MHIWEHCGAKQQFSNLISPLVLILYVKSTQRVQLVIRLTHLLPAKSAEWDGLLDLHAVVKFMAAMETQQQTQLLVVTVSVP